MRDTMGQLMNYDPIAQSYDDFEKDAITLWKLGYPRVMRLLGNVAGRRVLDYGCGSGTFSRFLEENGAIVTGVDVSKNMIEIARKNGPANIKYMTIPAGGTKFLRDGSFDLIVSNFVLCTIPTRDELHNNLNGIHRILRKGGRFVFMNSNWDVSNGREFVSFRLEYCKKLFSGQSVKAIIKSDPLIILADYYWSKDDYLGLLKQSGFHFREMAEPLAGVDGEHWLDEENYPPYYIIAADK